MLNGFFGKYSDIETDALDDALFANLACFFDSTGVLKRERAEVAIKLIGPKHRPCYKGKAGPSRRLLPWILDVLCRQGGARFLGDEGHSLLECSRALSEIYAVLACEPRRMSEAALLHIDGLCVQCFEEWKASWGQRDGQVTHCC